MAGSLKDAYKNIVLEALFRNVDYASTATFMALYTSAPTDSAAGTEVANAGSYARQAITFGAASGGSMTNSSAVTFPQATADWGTVTGFAIVDSATYGGGNQIAYGDITPNQSIPSGVTASFAISAITCTQT